jgi:hypothetical protein
VRRRDEGGLAWNRPLTGALPLAPPAPLTPLPRPRRPAPDPHSVAAAQGVADEVAAVMTAELGPGCTAAPAPTFDGSTFDNRLLAFEVPMAYADRLIDAFAITKAARRLVAVVERLARSAEPGSRPHISTIGAYNALRWAVRGQAGRQQARAALHREESPVLVLDAHTQAVGRARLTFTNPAHVTGQPVAEVELVGPFSCATQSAVDENGRHYIELVLRAEVRRVANTEEWRKP